MAILLSLEESPEQIISGFPEYVILSTNVPSTIFYTLDGTIPTENSFMFVDAIILPTNGLTLTIKAIAISGLVSSAVLEREYFTNQSALGKTRMIGKEGINIIPPLSTSVNHLSFDSDGNPVQESSILFVDLELKGSTSNNRGEDIPGDTTIDFINFNIKTLNRQETIISSPNNQNANFDPKASYLIIDGSTPEALEGQVVKIINRPHNTLDLISRVHNSNMQSYQLNTSSFVRYMIDPKSGKITFYYRDSRENRWLKSTQKIEGEALHISPTAGPPNSFVFRWIEDRAQSLIY